MREWLDNLSTNFSSISAACVWLLRGEKRTARNTRRA
jgi:hypothetical protein